MFLNSDAAYTYLFLSDCSYNNNLILEEEYMERLLILKQLVNPLHSDILHTLQMKIDEFDGLQLDTEAVQYDVSAEFAQKQNNEVEGQKEDFQGDDFDPSLHLISKRAGKISKWQFHKTDSDFFPSIPHGHAIINNKIKLDVYRGHIYRNNILHDRETREFIIDLWNDGDFRNAARQTIQYYLKTFPTYKWRVEHPLILPRRRKYY